MLQTNKNSGFLFAIFLIVAVFLFVYPIPSFANCPPDCFSAPPLPQNYDPVTADTIEVFLGDVANFLIITSTVIAAIYIVWGGITWMYARADETKLKNAKTRVKNGIIGALIVLAFGVILNTISYFVEFLSLY